LRQRARRTLERLGCEHIEDELPATLPFALQKRVSLARALVSEPELLLLDEPASGLSSADLPELGDIVGSLGQEIAVMLVEHHMDLVMSVCDRVTVLDFGRVIASGTPAEIKQNSAVLEAYLGRETTADAPTQAPGPTHARG
jgi:branched-chain amino acid transport system ATP-binding protein